MGTGRLVIVDEYRIKYPDQTWRPHLAESLSNSRAIFDPYEFGDSRFGRTYRGCFFPIWYAALAFALAGVGILRIGRFTIRSVLIVTMIVAALLGMVVIL
jgi:hypothetical protein